MFKFCKAIAIALALGGAFAVTPASAQCVVPNTLTNGQVADATEVMENFDAVADCADDVGAVSVTTTGTPASGELAVFSGTKTVSGGDLTGDVTTSGSSSTSLSATGVTAGSYSNTSITVDGKGRITAASNGSGTGGSGGGSSVFHATMSGSANNVTGDGTNYKVPINTTVQSRSFVSGVSSGTITISELGTYFVEVSAKLWGGSSGDWSTITVEKNGAEYAANGHEFTNEGVEVLRIGTMMDLSPGDTLQYRIRIGASSKVYDLGVEPFYNQIRITKVN